MKYFCLRFDVETHKCLRDGVPKLLDLAKKFDVKFTFFVNFGQAVNRIAFLNSRLKQTNLNEKTLSAWKKLGWRDYLYISLFNPIIGDKELESIKALQKSGHEIGLHGGKNHESWFRFSKIWTSKRIKEEISWSMNQLQRTGGKDFCQGFASPGWSGSEKIYKILPEFGFTYTADIHTNEVFEKVQKIHGIKNVPTNITGEPGGVGYIEHCRACHMSNSEIMNDFRSKLIRRKRLAVTYDHPYYAGIYEIELLENMLSLVKKMGYKIVTMKEIAKVV
jgi:peptidoglycan/xylan/chitin deacetylase (PgdA/CDA1 family)